jgi:calcineurin-like phosphoesterase family protein
MNTFCVADWHLGEDRFELMGRPFATKNQHIRHLIAEHNVIVGENDLVYVNGDACYQKSPESLSLIAKFNGRKILIRGNHDRVFTDEQLAPYFEQIIPEGDGIEIDVEGIPCYITHYPTCGRQDLFNLTGHIHSAWKYQKNMFNVGVDVNGFRPVNLTRIPFHLKAIKEFYDDDVWVAYNEINLQFIGKRGKKGSYSDKIT